MAVNVPGSIMAGFSSEIQRDLILAPLVVLIVQVFCLFICGQ